ncbi:MAG: hypothetical protein VCB80_04435 [Deltaproteobacteria bacterium]
MGCGPEARAISPKGLGTTAAQSDTGSTNYGQAQFIVVAGPAAGTWHLLVDRVAGVDAVQLTATVIGD